MKKRVKITTSNRSAIVGIVPIMVGVLVFVWSLWFFGFEADHTSRIMKRESVQSIQYIIALRAAEKRVVWKSKKKSDGSLKYSDEEVQGLVDKFIDDLMILNKIN